MTTQEPEEVIEFPNRHLVTRALMYGRLESTNDTAAKLALDPANVGLAVVARHQTAGRGQYGRAWCSPPDSSLTLSLILRATPGRGRPVMLTAFAAVGVANAIRELTGRQARVKWPNDLLVGGRKVCGILIEQSAAVVVGVGLNLTQTTADFEAAGLPDATSLATVSGRDSWPIAGVLEVVLRQLDGQYSRLLGDDWAALEDDWRKSLDLVGYHVLVETADGQHIQGRVRSLAFEALELDIGEIVPRVLAPEAVRGVRRL